jgi:uncharacterized DUF497 family protein
VALRFTWDRAKSAANAKKHGVTFEEAVTAFADPLSITIPDPDHSLEEERCILLGVSGRGRLVVVVHVDRGDEVRLISARQAVPRERTDYEEGTR